MLRVVCPNDHHTAKRDPNEWRHLRGCAVCGEATLVDYGNRCSHSGWRYPNELPIDGSLCRQCGCEYIDPIHFMDEAALERVRGVGELLSVLLEEADGYYEHRDATRAIQDICSAHRFTYVKGSSK